MRGVLAQPDLNLIEQHLRANAANITGAADNENLHRVAILALSLAELKFAIRQLR